MALTLPAGWDVTVQAGNLKETKWQGLLQDACLWAQKKAFELIKQSVNGEKVTITIVERER